MHLDAELASQDPAFTSVTHTAGQHESAVARQGSCNSAVASTPAEAGQATLLLQSWAQEPSYLVAL